MHIMSIFNTQVEISTVTVVGNYFKRVCDNACISRHELQNQSLQTQVYHSVQLGDRG